MRTVRRNQGRVHARAGIGLASADTAAASLPAIEGSPQGRLTPALNLTAAIRPLLDRDGATALVLMALGASAFIPGANLGFGSHSDGVAARTATTLILMFAGVMFFGRFSQRRQLRSLLLACATTTTAISMICSQVLSANHVQVFAQSGGWVALCGRLIGWLLIASSAVMPDRALARGEWGTRRRVKPIRLLQIAVGAIVAVGVGAYVIASDPTSHVALSDPTAVLRVRIMIAVLASIAALAFLRQRRRDSDLPVRLLAFAAVLGAASAVAYCAMPTLSSTLQTGVLLRLCAVSVLALSVCLEWFVDERRTRAQELAAERQRLAADVHDLIMQDLSLALATARTLADPQASVVIEAAERALAGARGVLNGLTQQPQKPIVEAVEEGVRAGARRAQLTFDGQGVPSHARPDAPTRDALLHIGREAVTNAVKHSHSDAVEVTLAYEDEWHLTVRANGQGFDPSALERDAHRSGTGFGLDSMRRSAEKLGGSLRVTSAIGEGTTVEALLP
jgi:signal transduction histidine kinase